MNTITNNTMSQANEGYMAGWGWNLVKRLLGFGPPPRLVLPPRLPPRIPRGPLQGVVGSWQKPHY